MDKLAGEMIGAPVVTLEGGETIARIEDMIVDPSRKQVLAVVVQEKAVPRRARAIPFGRIIANGPDAVIVQNNKVALDIDHDPVLKGLDNGHKVQGATVMTDDGRKIGTITDMLIDDHTGEIKSYQMLHAPGEEAQTIPAESVVSLGKDILYVSSAMAGQLGTRATKVIDVANAGVTKKAEDESSAAAGMANEGLLDAMVGSTSGLTDITSFLGGTTMNTKLFFGIVILVLGILILVYPALLPLIAGISLIVIGLWIALQNAPTGTRP